MKDMHDVLEEEAYISACEIVGPNSLEFDKVYEACFDALLENYRESKVYNKAISFDENY